MRFDCDGLSSVHFYDLGSNLNSFADGLGTLLIDCGHDSGVVKAAHIVAKGG